MRVNDTIGDYRIVAPIKMGGMAMLYLAERKGAAGFAREVAIKVVRHDLADDPQYARMLVDEALLSARIHHPNVVHVEELREVDGAFLLVMEYVHGATLALLMRELAARHRRLATALAVGVAVQIAEGLHAAHETRDDDGAALQVVHRDVSPQNVLIGYSGHVKLIDFGIAKVWGRGQTRAGRLRGKLGYMAPEQAWGRAVDRRTDVYGLGIVLWEMLTMRRLFHHEDEFALLERVRHPSIASPRSLVPELPAALDRVVMSALAADPAARPTSAEAFALALIDAVPSAQSPARADLSRLLAAMVPPVPRGVLRRETPVETDATRDTADANEAIVTLTLDSPTADSTLATEGGSSPPLEPDDAMHADLARSASDVAQPRRRVRGLALAASLVAVLAGAIVATRPHANRVARVAVPARVVGPVAPVAPSPVREVVAPVVPTAPTVAAAPVAAPRRRTHRTRRSHGANVRFTDEDW